MAFDQDPEPGIIPALAGNTPYLTHGRSRCRDHPRACGEHVMCDVEERTCLGSSPRLRGTPFSVPRLDCCQGIIPALAGNTCPRNSVRTCSGDHPRACGEHIGLSGTCNCFQGSSPRLRGTPGRAAAPRVRDGIIPALAGNTSVTSHRRTCPRDHPRACGEHYPTVDKVLPLTGSSPRLRGTQREPCDVTDLPGIIPALAGNTPCSTIRRPALWDHPRACGEHLHALRLRELVEGSSPRLRGTRDRHTRPRPQPGIIPALAGNTHMIPRTA